MRLKQFILTFAVMLSCFTFSAVAQERVTVHNAAELRAALTMNSGARRAASTTGATARALKMTIELDDYTDPNEVNAILAAGYDVTLNLNGCTLAGNFVNEGTLTIVDTPGGGSIVGSITNKAGATLNVNGGSIVAGGNDPAITNNGTASVASGVTVTGAIEGSVTGIENAIVNVASVNGVGYNTFAAAVEAELAVVEPMNEEEVNAYILEHSAEVDDEEAEMLLQAVLQVVIVDGVLGEEEVDNVLSIASALGIDDARAVLMLADLVKEEPELQVEL